MSVGKCRWGGVIIFQVCVGVSVRSLSFPHLFQFSKKFLEVSSLGRGRGYFWDHSNGINGRVGFQKIGMCLGWEQVLMEFLL